MQESSNWEASSVSIWGTTTEGTLKVARVHTNSSMLKTVLCAGISTTDVRELRMNLATGALLTSSAQDEDLELGDAFRCNYSQAVATDTTLTLLVTNNASTKYLYMDLDIGVQAGIVDVKMYEIGLTDAVAGTTCTIYNRNRTSTNTSSTTVTSTPTSITAGTTVILADKIISASVKDYRVGGSPLFKLNKSKQYYLLLTPAGAGTNNMSVNLTWHEHSGLT